VSVADHDQHVVAAQHAQLNLAHSCRVDERALHAKGQEEKKRSVRARKKKRSLKLQGSAFC
jgi:hypothetical protein